MKIILEMISSSRLAAEVPIAPQIHWDGEVKKVLGGIS